MLNDECQKRNLTAPKSETPKSSGILAAFMYFLLIRNCKAKQKPEKGLFFIALRVSLCVCLTVFTS